MHKLVSFVLFLLYRYHKQRRSTEDIAYFSAVGLFIILILANLLTLLLLFNTRPSNLLPGWSSVPRWVQYVAIAVIVYVPGYLAIGGLFKEKDISENTYGDDTISRGNTGLICYSVLSLLVFIIIAKVKS